MTQKNETLVKVRPILIWEQQNNQEQSSNVIPLFGNKSSEEVVQEIVIQTSVQEVQITSISSGFGNISMQHNSAIRMAA
ncbi:hypothetical protein [Fredinandcohnia quinoae]|uniref:Uncharacterized protein n=1 Tax=Fredinandcohnia quinoae TaxID=2918902 RepID=A0AAW5E3X5_9BACI|nr:hypothetical protein [Fredinandcohnia sp. SECRCQ15]MCH1627631.1 hypothetical protein [Fredinandcohnia sp. SECRCQ15]